MKWLYLSAYLAILSLIGFGGLLLIYFGVPPFPAMVLTIAVLFTAGFMIARHALRDCIYFIKKGFTKVKNP